MSVRRPGVAGHRTLPAVRPAGWLVMGSGVIWRTDSSDRRVSVPPLRCWTWSA